MKKRLFLLLGILISIIIILVYKERHHLKDLYQKSTQPSVSEVASPEVVSNEHLKITFLDIGQGDASFIEWPNGMQMLVDCAMDSRILEALGRVMSPRDREIDYLLITHPHEDHYGGCVDVLKRFEVKNIVYSGYDKTSSNYFPVFEETVEAEGATYHEVEAEQIWNIASSTIHFLYPDFPIMSHPVVKKIGAKDASNNTSIVFVLEYQNKRVLFTGDAEQETENYLVAKYGESLDVDALKVGHHGSSGSSLEDFLSLVQPEIAIISSGKENKYGHPALRTLKRLERVDAQVWRTDQKGDIILNIHNEGIYVENQ